MQQPRISKPDCHGRPWVSKGRHGPFRVALHAASRRQGTGLDPGPVSGGADARWLRRAVLLSDASIARRSTLAATRCSQEIETLIARYSPYSEEREQFSAALYSTSEILKIDGEGRVVLSESLKTHAEIADAVTFAGLGHKFQIWEPDRFRAELAEATEKVRAWKKQLGSRVAAEGPHGARE